MIRKLNAIVERKCSATLGLQHAEDSFGSRCLGAEWDAASQKEPRAAIDECDQKALLTVHGVTFPVAEPAARIC
jgi:hypothetical protein